MAVFSTDQNRQFYYAGAYQASTLSNPGDVKVVKDKDNNLHIQQLGKGGIVKTDVIDITKILGAKASAPADMQKKLKQVNLALSAECNGGKPIAGEDYVVRINFRQLYGMSDEDIYQKYGAVAATSTMETKTDLFWLTLAQSLFKNFKRTFSPLLKIGLNEGTIAEDGTVTVTDTKVIKDIKCINGVWSAKLDNDATTTITPGTTYVGIAIIEDSLVSEWVLGTAKLETINFEVIPTTVYDGTQDIVWGAVELTESGETIGNGYDTADLEYFCMGERGDQYRKQMWPNNIDTKYFVNPEGTYYYLDIAYAYAGDCEDIQNSKKLMTIVAPSKAIITSLITALGITVDKTTNFGA